MKKLAFLFVAVAAISFASCGNGTQQAEAVDTLAVDTTVAEVVDTTIVDTLVEAVEEAVEAVVAE
ncbi:MAG: hypothetical protein IJ197_09605 [Bacteroidaceae bacterium]|nr:hypothetical protein [Bacteroidaceae bacterium]